MKKEIIIIICLFVIIALGLSTYYIINNQQKSHQPANNPIVSAKNLNEVLIKNNSFSPTKSKIKIGSSIVFVNKDNVAQIITEKNKVFNKEIKPGDTLKVTFEKAGTYDYSSNLYPETQGSVIVE